MSRVCRNGVLAEGDATPGSFPVGAAFFETIALRAGVVECLDDHLERLRAGLARAGLTPNTLETATLALIGRGLAKRNKAGALSATVAGENARRALAAAKNAEVEVY